MGHRILFKSIHPITTTNNSSSSLCPYSVPCGILLCHRRFLWPLFGVVRFFASNWTQLQRGRSRLVHIAFPPTVRSMVVRLQPKTDDFLVENRVGPGEKEKEKAVNLKEDDDCNETNKTTVKWPLPTAVSPPFAAFCVPRFLPSFSCSSNYFSSNDYQGKLLFVTYGYIDRLQVDKLKEETREKLWKRRKGRIGYDSIYRLNPSTAAETQGHRGDDLPKSSSSSTAATGSTSTSSSSIAPILYSGRLPWEDIRHAVTRTEFTCLSIATEGTHRLIENFTLEEIQEMEKWFDQIDEAFQTAERMCKSLETSDRLSRQTELKFDEFHPQLFG